MKIKQQSQLYNGTKTPLLNYKDCQTIPEVYKNMEKLKENGWEKYIKCILTKIRLI